MASPTRRPVGRPKLPGCLKMVRVRDSVFDLWRARKQALGFEKSTDSVFMEFLLHRRRPATDGESAEGDLSLSVEDDGSGPSAVPL
ncbi:hypothetical protein ACROYT_G022022 [Oculina patagonica]